MPLIVVLIFALMTVPALAQQGRYTRLYTKSQMQTWLAQQRPLEAQRAALAQELLQRYPPPLTPQQQLDRIGSMGVGNVSKFRQPQ